MIEKIDFLNLDGFDCDIESRIDFVLSCFKILTRRLTLQRMNNKGLLRRGNWIDGKSSTESIDHITVNANQSKSFKPSQVYR